jgi:protoporphyrinogen/coproporphyrinogen III oxidase
MSPAKITILGGGITGLSAAFHLSRKFPSSRITLLEKSDRLGGWVHSKRVQFPVPGGDVGSAVLELGPRTMRPQSKALLEMARMLELCLLFRTVRLIEKWGLMGDTGQPS